MKINDIHYDGDVFKDPINRRLKNGHRGCHYYKSKLLMSLGV